MYYIGVDLGTSAVKLLLMEGNGKICNIVSNEYPLSFPQPGWSEQKPEDWWNAVVDGIKKLINGFDASEVAGISFGGQMHGLVILDENDNEFARGIVNYDSESCKKVMGSHSDDIMKILNFKNYDAIITRDNITIL